MLSPLLFQCQTFFYLKPLILLTLSYFFQFLKELFLREYISAEIFVERVRLVQSMPQNAVLIPRLKHLEKFLAENKVETKILSNIRNLSRELKRNS